MDSAQVATSPRYTQLDCIKLADVEVPAGGSRLMGCLWEADIEIANLLHLVSSGVSTNGLVYRFTLIDFQPSFLLFILNIS